VQLQIVGSKTNCSEEDGKNKFANCGHFPLWIISMA